MKINKTATYALVSVGYIAENYNDGWVRSESISKEYSISMTYLQKIFQRLVKVNILKSKRGQNL